MGQVISFINMKGGVAKTTLAVNVAYGLAHFHHKQVLLVDADPQFNATQYLVEDDAYIAHMGDRSKGSLLDVLIPRRDGSINTVTGFAKPVNRSRMSLPAFTIPIYAGTSGKGPGGRLDIIPSTLKLIDSEAAPRGTERMLNNFINERARGYDYVIIDCPPTVSLFSQAAVLASQKYIVPIKPDPLSIVGLPLLERWLDDCMERYGIRLEKIGMVFTLVRANVPRMNEVMDTLRANHGEEMFQSHLSVSTHVAESVEHHQPIFKYKPWSSGEGDAVDSGRVLDPDGRSVALAENRRHHAFLAFAQKALGVPASYSKEDLERFRETAFVSAPPLIPVIDAYLRLAQAAESEAEPLSPEPPRGKSGRKPGSGESMHLFDLLRQKRLFPSNPDLITFAASILPNMSRTRFRKMSRGDIAARIIEYLETLDPGTRDAFERSMREAMSRDTNRAADRRDFFSRWERIIKGTKL